MLWYRPSCWLIPNDEGLESSNLLFNLCGAGSHTTVTCILNPSCIKYICFRTKQASQTFANKQIQVGSHSLWPSLVICLPYLNHFCYLDFADDVEERKFFCHRLSKYIELHLGTFHHILQHIRCVTRGKVAHAGNLSLAITSTSALRMTTLRPQDHIRW